MTALRLALRMLVRDARAGELTVLIAAIVLAVGSVGTVAFFADRVKTALTRQANLLLGADVLVSGDRPLPESLADEARRRGLAATPGAQVQQHGAAGRRGPGRRRGAGGREGSRGRLSAARRDPARRPRHARRYPRLRHSAAR